MFKKEILAIIVLFIFLTSAIGYIFYIEKQKKEILENNRLGVYLYIAKDNIPKNKLIKKTDLKKIEVEKKWFNSDTLLMNDIVGKYAKKDIYKNTTFSKDLLSNKPVVDKGIIENPKYSKYAIDFNLFTNSSFNLKSGDFINIAFVVDKSKKNSAIKNIETGYGSLKNIRILGFLYEGETYDKAFKYEEKDIKTKNKKIEKRKVKVFANKIILDMKQNDILLLLKKFNEGKQIWLINLPKTISKFKQIKHIEDKKEVKAKKDTNKRKKRIYKRYMYVGKKIKESKIKINYIDNPSKNKVKVFKEKIEQCSSDKNHLLLGISQKVFVRSNKSIHSKPVKILRKNVLMSYLKEDKNWFKICNGYVSKKEAIKLNKKQAKYQLMKLSRGE